MSKFLPKEAIKGHRGYYPVCNQEEWDALPKVFRSMTWYPTKVYNMAHSKVELTIPEYIEFDTIFYDPYKIRGGVFRVHVSEVQKILFCSVKADLFLGSVCGVVFQNKERWVAKTMQDSKTGAFAIYACGNLIGKQGGYMSHIPDNIEETEDGFKWRGVTDSKNREHYELSSPWK